MPPMVDSESQQLCVYVRFRQLSSLLLSGNDLDDVSLATIATGMATLKKNLNGKINITTLDLTDNKLSGSGKVLSEQIICALPKLARLYLGYNRLTPATTALVMNSLSKSSSLTEIDFSWNQIGNAGAILLGSVIGKTKLLRRVKVVHCSIMARGAMVLFDGLQRNQTVEHFDISQNAIGEDGGQALLRLWGAREMECELVWKQCNVTAVADTARMIQTKDLIAIKQ